MSYFKLISLVAAGLFYNIVNINCSRCNKKHLDNYKDRLLELKKFDEYKPDYDRFERLCSNCWTDISTVPCSLCETDFNVLRDNKKELQENLKQYNILSDYPKAKVAKHICPTCFWELQHTKCSRCQKIFQSIDNKADYKVLGRYRRGGCYSRDNFYRTNKEINKWLYPYSSFYSTSWYQLCPSCYDECHTACHEIQENIKNWVSGTKHEYIKGFNTVKALGRIEYQNRSCLVPAELEECLKLYSVQLGGNGFVKFYYEKNEERHSNSVLAGYSVNGNPYYRTEYSTKRWFTGYATAVIIKER